MQPDIEVETCLRLTMTSLILLYFNERELNIKLVRGTQNEAMKFSRDDRGQALEAYYTEHIFCGSSESTNTYLSESSTLRNVS